MPSRNILAGTRFARGANAHPSSPHQQSWRGPRLAAKDAAKMGHPICGRGLGDEEEFAGGLAGFEVAVGVAGIGERIDVFEAEFEGAVGYAVEDVFDTGLEVGGRGDVILHGWAGDVEGAHGGEADEVEAWDGAAGSAEEDHESAGAEALEGLLGGGFAYGVVDDGEAAA